MLTDAGRANRFYDNFLSRLGGVSGKLAIYGAGKKGHLVRQFLDEHGFADRFGCYVVTGSAHGAKDTLCMREALQK